MLYAITDRRLYGGDEVSARAGLLELTATWAAHGVSWIQLREKDLPAHDQVELARTMVRVMRARPKRGVADEAAQGTGAERLAAPRLLINGRADVALAAGADGVHLPAGPDGLTPEEVRRIFAAAGRAQTPRISISCHTLEEVAAARQQKVDCILFAPVFEKVLRENEAAAATRMESERGRKLPGTGLRLLEQACHAAAPVPVFALGGVTAENAADCLRAGAAGIAAIRLLQEPASVWERWA